MIRCIVLLLMIGFLSGCTSALHARQLAEAKRSFHEGDYKASVRRLLPLACEGDPQAQYALGYVYYYGYGVPQDIESGRFWIQRSAAQHYPPAEQGLKALIER